MLRFETFHFYHTKDMENQTAALCVALQKKDRVREIPRLLFKGSEIA